jgi:hypothetical protein
VSTRFLRPMAGRASRALAVVTSLVAMGGMGLAAAPPSQAQAVHRPQEARLGKPWSIPRSKVSHARLGSFAPTGETALQRAEGAAAALAAREHHPVAVAGLQTENEIVTASGNGMLTLRSYPEPVQVEQSGKWLAVDTNLRREGGALTAPVLPGDWVRFSPGGSGPMAQIGTGRSSLALWWPRRLPAPVVLSSSATYRNALPGVNLVLTAENGATGSFSEALVVSNARAAREVSQLRLGVTSQGARLADVGSGGLVAPLAGGGEFVATAPAMWDSSTSSRGLAERAAAIGGRAAGLVASGGVAVSTFQGPGRDAVVAPVAEQVSGGGRVLRLVPDAKMLTSSLTRFPVDIVTPAFSVTGAPGQAGVSRAASVGGEVHAAALRAAASPSLYTETNGGGGLEAYDPVQSTCTSSHYDSSSYYDSPVGYDNWGGECSVNDTDYALYRVGVSAALGAAGVEIATATVNVSEAYSSSCSDTYSPVVSLTWIDGIDSGTGWPGPKAVSGQSNVNVTFPPDDNGGSGAEDTWSCNAYAQTDDGLLVSKGFNVKSDIDSMLGSSSFTFRLSETASDEEAGATDADYYHAQFTNGKHDSDGPYLQVQFFDKPGTVSTSTMEEATSSAENPAYTCAKTDGDGQTLVPTSAGGGVWVGATHTDPDGESVLGGTIRYFLASDPSSYDTLTVTDSPAKGVYPRVWAEIPYSWLSAQPNGSEIGWITDSYTGTATVAGTTYGPIYTPSYSDTCYFADYWDKPDAPSIAANFTQADAQPVGSTVTFSITPSANDTNAASEYVYSLDAMPPTTGTIPDSELCTTSSTTTPDCAINSSGDATLSVVVASPGPHTLYVYEIDDKNVVSGETTAGLPDSSTDCQSDDVTGCAWAGYTFTGSADPGASYTSQSSLQANFSKALQSGYAGNTLISNSNGTACSSATGGDGSGDYLDASQLSSAGWTSGGEVTVDGASFTLPSYGSCSAADNVLAANQTIGTGGSGISASALVFLATSTDGSDPGSEVGVGGVLTGDPNADALQSDDTVPAVMGGTATTGSGCLEDPNFGDAACTPATGTVNYAAGCSAAGNQTSVPYYLTAPDWETGPADIQAITTSDQVNSRGLEADSPKIYAFAVPLYPDCTLVSVTLPDVGQNVYAATPSGDGIVLPGLHIFGMSLRNNTTATPEASGSSVSSPADTAWTGAEESPVQGASAPPSGVTWGNQTFRAEVTPTVSGPSGSQIRIELSDPGFLAADGDGPLTIGAASIGTSFYGWTPGQTPVELTFGGSDSVTIPEGGMVYSDPVTLSSSTFTVTAGEPLLVSFWIENSSLPVLPANGWGSAALEAWAPSSTPNETEDTTGTPFNGTGSWFGGTAVLTGVDITTPAETVDTSETVNSLASDGDPTVVVAGNNVIDGLGTDALSDSLNVPSERLAGQLYSQGLSTGYGVVDAGITANQVMADGTSGEVSLIARLDRDVLSEPDVGTVVIDEGLQDLLSSAPSEEDLDTAYAVLINELDSFGINVIVTTMTPCDGYDSDGHSCTATVTDPTRSAVNEDVTGSNYGLPTGEPYCAADVDSVVSNGGSPEALSTSPTDYDSGDHANLSYAGYAAMADAFNLTNADDAQYSPCGLAPDDYALPPS